MTVTIPSPPVNEKALSDIRGISLPQGFHHVVDFDSTFAGWLLHLKLRKDNKVYLYNGQAKPNQDIHYGVLEIPIGKKDLLQCADAAIKLRADHLFQHRQFDKLTFTATSGDEISFQSWLKGIRWKEKSGRLASYQTSNIATDISNAYKAFMELVFSYCGTYSLSRQLRPVNDINLIKPGDIFVEGGFPGHAVTVMAVAKNDHGQTIFLLSQGYMPAQDVHVLKNFRNPGLSPWYALTDLFPLYTPQWQFEKGSLKRW